MGDHRDMTTCHTTGQTCPPAQAAKFPTDQKTCPGGQQTCPGMEPTHKGEKDWYKNAKSIYEFSAIDIDGHEVRLDKYKGNLCIIVNVASDCATAKQNYEQLQMMYQEFKDKGLKILAFPCNQFAGGEPLPDQGIKKHVQDNYGVTFDMFSKVDVNGSNAHDLWKYLQHTEKGTLFDFVKWSFTKFLIDRNGQPVERYAPTVEPFEIKKDLPKYW